jgi:hypothetical protein
MKHASRKVRTRVSFLKTNLAIPRKKGKMGLLRQNSSTPPEGNIPNSAIEAWHDRQPAASDHGNPLIELDRGLFSLSIEINCQMGTITIK